MRTYDVIIIIVCVYYFVSVKGSKTEKLSLFYNIVSSVYYHTV